MLSDHEYRDGLTSLNIIAAQSLRLADRLEDICLNLDNITTEVAGVATTTPSPPSDTSRTPTATYFESFSTKGASTTAPSVEPASQISMTHISTQLEKMSAQIAAMSASEQPKPRPMPPLTVGDVTPAEMWEDGASWMRRWWVETDSKCRHWLTTEGPEYVRELNDCWTLEELFEAALEEEVKREGA